LSTFLENEMNDLAEILDINDSNESPYQNARIDLFLYNHTFLL